MRIHLGPVPWGVIGIGSTTGMIVAVLGALMTTLPPPVILTVAGGSSAGSLLLLKSPQVAYSKWPLLIGLSLLGALLMVAVSA